MISAYNKYNNHEVSVSVGGIRLSIFKVQKCTTEKAEFGYCTVPRDTIINFVDNKTQIVAFKKYAEERSKVLRNNYSIISCSERVADNKRIMRKLLDDNYGTDFDIDEKNIKNFDVFGSYTIDITVEDTRNINWMDQIPIEFFLTYKNFKNSISNKEGIVGRSSILLYQEDDYYCKKTVKKYPAVELKYIDCYEITVDDKRYEDFENMVDNLSSQDNFDILSDDYRSFYSFKKYGIPDWFIDQLDLQNGVFSFNNIYTTPSGKRLGPMYLPKQLEMEL